MSINQIEWLPGLILFSDHNGDWDCYLAAIYEAFRAQFIVSSPEFRGIRLGLKRHPMIQGKEATFWHMISEGSVEEERLPDFRRCERIRWPRPVIEHETHHAVKLWKNKRGTETRILIWLETEDYLVILSERKDYILPWTAYLVEQDHRKRKLQREFENYQKNPW